MRDGKKILLLCFALFPLFFVGQSNHYLKTKAYQAYYEKDWYAAEQYYSRFYERDSLRTTINYKYAEVCRYNNNLNRALYLYKKTAISAAKKYPLCYYWIGQVLKTKTDYKEASKWFLKFTKQKLGKNYGYYKTKAALEIEACELAQLAVNKNSDILLKHIDTLVNTAYSEYAAIEFEDALYYSSLRVAKDLDGNEKQQSKVYRASTKNGKPDKIKVLDTVFNSNIYHNTSVCFSGDKKRMVVSRCKSRNSSEYDCELHLSYFLNNKWQPTKRIEDSLNIQGFSSTQACFGKLNGKEVLFFSSNRPGGLGEMDIWFAEVNTDGSFSRAKNAGTRVNTADNEITPWFDTDIQTLYFSSTYHKGFGGYDIFKSTYRDSEFKAPENAGYPLNSSYNDLYFTLNPAKNKAYLSSNRPGTNFDKKSNCCNDIYFMPVKNETVAAKYSDTSQLIKEKLRLLVPLTLYFHNDEPNPKTENTSTALDYEQTYQTYKLLYPLYVNEFNKGYSRKLKVKANYSVESFFTDSLDGGYDALRKFTTLLKTVLLKGETVKITMKGYCSPLASTNYNKKLAKRRISSLRNYFIKVENGFFTKFMDTENKGATLIFEEVDIGELPDSKVSDDFKNKRSSVYSPHAASERKIQIIAISFGQ